MDMSSIFKNISTEINLSSREKELLEDKFFENDLIYGSLIEDISSNLNLSEVITSKETGNE